MRTMKREATALLLVLLVCTVLAAEDKPIRADRYGDPLPERAIARLGTVRLRHNTWVASVVFSRDGKTAIAGDTAGKIVVWDVATGREVRHFQRDPITPSEAQALSADGKTLVCAGDGPGRKAHLYLWDIETSKLLSRHELESGDGVQHLLFTPDGKALIVGHFENLVHVWDFAAKKVKHELKGSPGMLGGLALSPDGKTLASGNWEDSNIRLWDVASGKEKLCFKAHDAEVLRLAYSPDGKTIVSLGNAVGLVFSDANTGKPLRKIEERHGGRQAIQYAPDGKALFCADLDGLRVLDAVSGKQLRRLAAPGLGMTRLALSPDGKTLAAFGGSHAFGLWDVAGFKQLLPAPGHREPITSLVFSADGRQVFSAAGIGDVPLQVWDARTGERLHEIGENSNGVEKIVLSPDGKLLAACGYDDRTIRLWDVASRKEMRVFKGHGNSIDSLAWSADGKTLASSSWQEKSLRVWDAATGQQRWEKAISPSWATPVALSPDGKIVAAGGFPNGMIHLWSAESGKESGSIATPQQTVHTLAFSPDGSSLASGGELSAIHLWEPATGRPLHQWDAKAGWTRDVTFAPDGRTLVSGHGDGSVHLWEIPTGKERAIFKGHRGAVRSVAISRDGRGITSGSEDTTILVWDATCGVRPDAALSPEQLQTLWRELGDADAGRAYRALWQMALSPKHSLPVLAEYLHRFTTLDAARQKEVDRLVANLDSDRFTVRQDAEAELVKMGLMIEPALRRALENKPSLEVRRRIEAVLAKLTNERLRIARALEALEYMNTAGARRLLKSLAEGAPHAWLTDEARAICKRFGLSEPRP